MALEYPPAMKAVGDMGERKGVEGGEEQLRGKVERGRTT